MIEKREDSTLVNGDVNESITLEEDPVEASVSANDISVEVLTESTQLLEQHTTELKENISKCFNRLMDTLKYREKQLLRQIDVLHSQQLAQLQSSQPPVSDLKSIPAAGIPELSVHLGGETDLLESILSFAKVSLGSGSLIGNEGNTSPYSLPYKLEDYQDATHDHMCLYKPLSVDDESATHHVIKFGFAPKLNLSDTSRSPPDVAPEEEPEGSHSAVEEPKSDEASETGSTKERRPSQVQQWLQQILAETETEPNVGEVAKNFHDVSAAETCD